MSHHLHPLPRFHLQAGAVGRPVSESAHDGNDDEDDEQPYPDRMIQMTY